MKQQIISEVMQQMLPHLDNAQMRQLQKVLEKLARNDLCVQNGSRWRLTPKGFMLSNQVILTLLEAQQRSKPLAQRH